MDNYNTEPLFHPLWKCTRKFVWGDLHKNERVHSIQCSRWRAEIERCIRVVLSWFNPRCACKTRQILVGSWTIIEMLWDTTSVGWLGGWSSSKEIGVSKRCLFWFDDWVVLNISYLRQRRAFPKGFVWLT